MIKLKIVNPVGDVVLDEIITQYNFMTPNVDAKKYWIEVKKEIEKL